MPSFFIDSPAASLSHIPVTSLGRSPTPPGSHISFFRSLFLDLQIYSPSVKVAKLSGLETTQSYPVFCDQDKIKGKIILDPSCSQNGHLTISLEGTFGYSSADDNPDDEHTRNQTVIKYQHVFLSSSAAITISSVPDSRLTIREALGVRRRPSASSLKSSTYRSCEFSFELFHWPGAGEEMPPTFSSKAPTRDSRGQSHTEEFGVAYHITAVWEASDGSQPKSILEAPVLFQSDFDFQSCDGSAVKPEFWLEIPLIPGRPIPFHCAVTLPRSQSFPRHDSVPYFVVFSTHDRSPCLVKEIAADATITVSLIRNITIAPQCTLQIPALLDTPPASDESDNQTSLFAPYSRLLKRSVKTPAGSHTRSESFSATKSMPEFPQKQKTFTVSRTLETQLFIGFPKRPRATEVSQNLPDRLCKGKVQLSKDMLPSVEWPGVSVKYYLDVSVLVGQDDMRACIPIKIY